jgi:predicted ATPase
MERHGIVELHVRNLRTLEDVSLEFNGLTVLIGDNGSGKSTLLEVLELLRRAAEPRFTENLVRVHGGVGALERLRAEGLVWIRVIVAWGGLWSYEIKLSGNNGHASVAYEEICALDPKDYLAHSFVERTHDELWYQDEAADKRVEARIAEDQLALTAFGVRPPNVGVDAVVQALRAIEVHVPFEVTPTWVARSTLRQSALREEGRLEPADRLDRLGANLASAWHSLKNDFDTAHWHETLELVRLGLGDDIDTVNTRAGPGDGRIALWMKYRGMDAQLPASALSDGTLAFLAFVAMFRLNPNRSILAIDEPELHLHPHLLLRVLDFCESATARHPVVLATHSDRLLDGLSDPASSVVLCELDPRRATRLVRPDPAALARWLERYRGLGDVRAAGHERSVMTLRKAPR